MHTLMYLPFFPLFPSRSGCILPVFVKFSNRFAFVFNSKPIARRFHGFYIYTYAWYTYVYTRDDSMNACYGCLYSFTKFVQCAFCVLKDGALLFVISARRRETTHYKYTILKLNDLRCAK